METKKKKLVISSGAGISAESGINTFRDVFGQWENTPDSFNVYVPVHQFIT